MSAAAAEKLRAETIRSVTAYPESDYWFGYRVGLTVDKPLPADGIGSADAGRDAYCRGLRDGMAVRRSG